MGRVPNAYRLENYGDIKTRDHKHCSLCHNKWPLSNFYKSPTSYDGYYYICKPCARERNRSPKVRPDRKSFIVSRFPEVFDKLPNDMDLIKAIKSALIDEGYVSSDSELLTNSVFNLIVRIQNKFTREDLK